MMMKRNSRNRLRTTQGGQELKMHPETWVDFRLAVCFSPFCVFGRVQQQPKMGRTTRFLKLGFVNKPKIIHANCQKIIESRKFELCVLHEPLFNYYFGLRETENRMSDFARARLALHPSSAPATLPCRDDETELIEQFIRDVVTSPKAAERCLCVWEML
jgi:hypothetical protein